VHHIVEISNGIVTGELIIVRNPVGDPDLGGYRPWTQETIGKYHNQYLRQIQSQLGQRPRSRRRTSRHGQIVVENTESQSNYMPKFWRRKDQHGRIIIENIENHEQVEIFQPGVRYRITVGNCNLPNRVKASVASWLAYVAFENDLSFSKH
jgi:hypothetical protein